MDSRSPLRSSGDSPYKPKVPPVAPKAPSAAPKARGQAAHTPREQELSIRERKQLLFDGDEEATDVQPLPEMSSRRTAADFLRTTPATPLSAGIKAGLFAAGVVVVLLFLAALYKSSQRPAPRPKSRPPARTRKVSASDALRLPMLATSQPSGSPGKSRA